MRNLLPDCCSLRRIKVVGYLFDDIEVPPKLVARIDGYQYQKGSNSSLWLRAPAGERTNPLYWFQRVPDVICGCGCTIFSLRNRSRLLTVFCENCSHEEALCPSPK